MKRIATILCIVALASMAQAATLRTLMNRASVARDATNLYRLYAEDWNELLAKMQGGTDFQNMSYLQIAGVTTIGTSGQLLANEGGADADSHIEGDTDAALFYCDAGNDRVGIGTATPGVKFEVNGAAKATTMGLSSPLLTPGSDTGLTINDSGSLRTQVYKVSLAKENFDTAAVNHDVTIATLPAKSVVLSVIADVTQAFVCGSVCTTATLSATVGISAGGVEFLESYDLDATVAVFGDTDAEVGTKLDIAGATNSGYISWAGTAVVLRGVSGTGNWGDGAATYLSSGAVTIYVLYTLMP